MDTRSCCTKPPGCAKSQKHILIMIQRAFRSLLLEVRFAAARRCAGRYGSLQGSGTCSGGWTLNFRLPGVDGCRIQGSEQRLSDYHVYERDTEREREGFS